MSILKRALTFFVLTVAFTVSASLSVHYSYDKQAYAEQVHAELQRQSFAIKEDLRNVLQSGGVSALRRQLVSHENLFDETEIVVFNGNRLLASSLTHPPSAELSKYFASLGLGEYFQLDASAPKLNLWSRDDLYFSLIPICVSPLSYSKYFQGLERCTTVILRKSTEKKMVELQGLYIKLILINLVGVIVVTLSMVLIATTFWRKRTQLTFDFLKSFDISVQHSRIVNNYNDELSLFEGHINGLIERVEREQNLLEEQAQHLREHSDKIEQQKDAIEKANQKLLSKAHTDPLTGLLNRYGLSYLEEKMLDSGVRDKRALYLFDIDYFKSVNDEHSHNIGDQFLCAISNVVRNLCADEDTVCRFGGEEFLILRQWQSTEAALEFASELQKAVSKATVQSGPDLISRTISIGLVELEAEQSIDERFTHVDLALIEAKRRGRNEIVFADDEFIESMGERGEFLTSLEVGNAILNEEFVYFCQPIHNTKLGYVEGYEALIRWVKPSGEVVPPSVFLHMFQKVFFSPEFKNIRHKMRRQLASAISSTEKVYFSWNYDLNQLESETVTGNILAWARDLQNDLGCEVVIEISEQALYRSVNMEMVVENLTRLRMAGICIALDDFGVEHSNVQRLSELPISIIKLDKCLIDEIDGRPEKLLTIQHIANLARELDIKVIAEGVETQRQVLLLNQCEIYSHQGYHYSKPFNPSKTMSCP